MSDKWDFYFANVNDKISSLFVDLGIRETALDAQKPWLLWVWVYLNNPREDGLSQNPEAATLLEIEDVLTEIVGNATDGVLVGRITTDGHRGFYFYSATFVAFDEAVGKGLEQFPNYRFDSGTQHEPDWNQYLNLLYPSPKDWQRIKNRHVIEVLERHGDPLKKPRLVYHWAYFSNESSRDRFVAAINERGFAVTNQGIVDIPNHSQPLSLNFERVENVDWNSINEVTIELFELAESLEGDYDGWETSVEKDEL